MYSYDIKLFEDIMDRKKVSLRIIILFFSLRVCIYLRGGGGGGLILILNMF